MNSEQIEKVARESLQKLYAKFPMGCGEEDAKEFLKTEPYPEVSFAIMTREDYQVVVDQYADKD